MSYGNRGRGGFGGSGGRGGYGSGGGSSYGRPRSFAPKPVEIGKEYDVEITETSRRGDGIAKIQGFIIFVSGAKAGDKGKIKITNVGPRFANAELVSNQGETAASTTEEVAASTTEEVAASTTEEAK